MKRIVLFIVPMVAVLLGMSACKGNNPEQGEKKARYAILVYGNAGGSMDCYIENLWEQTKPLMTNRDVRLGFFYKYGKQTEGAEQKYGRPGDLLEFELTSETNLDSLRYTAAMSGWEDYELYDPELLQITIDLMAKDMPAENYILLIWGHGGGFDPTTDYPKDLRDGQKKARQGVVYDEWFPTGLDGQHGEGMSMYELSEAIRTSKVPHFKAIFFHNCLIGNMETLDEIYDKADYLFSSMHALFSDGAMIGNLIKGLYANTDFELAGKAALTDIPNWENEYQEARANGDMNFLKSSEFAALEPVFARLRTRLVELYPTQSAAIDEAFDKTYKVTSEHPFFDALDYANQLAKATQDPQLQTIAADMKTAFDRMWISRRHLVYNPQAPLNEFTLSLFMMDKQAYAQQVSTYQYTCKDAYEYSRFHKQTGWGNWINTNTHHAQGNPVGQVL